jgi:lipoprotein-anchoring transpeptidase ErfK/SrfK
MRPYLSETNKGDKVMLRVVVVMLAAVFSANAALAQWGPPTYGRSPYRQAPDSGFFGLFDDDDDDEPRRPMGPRFQSGGERPAIARIHPKRVAFPSSYPVGSIVIDHKGRQLFFIQSASEALRYPISVGREGFNWSGSEKISRIADWPDWHPPEEMRERDPRLPEKMTGGIRNPLGAKALYLGNSLYRIHGTNDARSIGRAASSGCFRMLNGHVVDLASRVQIGTQVIVVRRLPPALERTVAEQVGRPGERASNRSGKPS